MESVFSTDQLKEAAETGFVSSWRLPPKDIVLGSDEIHVWRASLDLEASRVQSLQQTLAVDELARAGRFYFQKASKRFIVARGLLRAILGRYLDMEPARLRFSHTKHGKPFLARELGSNALQFNLSHSDGLALYAVTHCRRIGIDLERVRADLVDEHVAEHFFSPREVALLRALPRSTQKEAIFNCWTRKEAYIKAKGQGLLLGLDQFDVSLVPGEPAALLSSNGDSQETSHWSLQELAPGPGFVAALAVEGYDWRIKCYRWSEPQMES